MANMTASGGSDGSDDEEEVTESQSSSSGSTGTDDVVSGTPGVSDRADRAAGEGTADDGDSSSSSSTRSSSSSSQTESNGTDDVVSGTPGVEDQADRAAEEGADDSAVETPSSSSRTTRTEHKYRQVAENTPRASTATQQGVEEGDGEVARQARELEQRVLEENEAIDDPSQVAVRREDGRLVAEPTRTGEQEVDLQARQEVRKQVASDMENVEAEDLTVTEENGEYRVSVRQDAQRQILVEQFEEENPYLDRGEDYEVQRTDGGYRIALTEEGQRERVRQQVASERDGVDPEDVELTESGETMASQSGGDRRLVNEAGTDGDDLMVTQYEVDISNDAEIVQSGDVETLSEEDAIDSGDNAGTTRSTRTDIAPEGMARDEGPGSEMLNRLDRNEDLAGSVEDVGDVEVMINDRRLESVFNEGSKLWDDASADVGERAGDGAGAVDDAGQTEIPYTGASAYEAAGVRTNDQGEGPVESGTEAVVAGVGRAANPYAIGSASKEVAEAGVYVGSAAVSGSPSETLDRTETVVNQAGVAGGLASQYAANNPVETAGTFVGGVLTGTAASAAASRAGTAASSVARRTPSPRVRQRTRAARARARQELGQRARAASTRARQEFGQAARLASDERAQTDFTKTITRDSAEADPSDPTPDEWARQKFEGESEQAGRTRNADRTSRDVKDQLPPKDAFPSEQAYQRELERARARQELPSEEAFSSRQEFQRELDRLVERRRSEQQTTSQSLSETETRTRQTTRAAGTTAGRPAGTLAVTASFRPRSRTDQLSALAQTRQAEELTTTETLFEERSQRGVYGTQAEAQDELTGTTSRERTGARTRSESRTDSQQTFDSTTTTTLSAESSLTAARSAARTATSTTTRSSSSSSRRVPRPDPDPSRDFGDAGASFESADARWETQFADADELADDLFGGGG